MPLVQEGFGSEGEVKVDIVDKKIVVSAVHASKGAVANVSVAVDPSYFLDKLKEKIPGGIDDAVIEVLKAAFLK
jgi:hypothetical protein